MSDQQLVSKTAEFMKQKFAKDPTGHDWWHLYRVWNLAKHIAANEKDADMLVVELAALLHDIADWKFHGGSEDAGPIAAREWLLKIGLDEERIEQVVYIVRHISFKAGVKRHVMKSVEGRIVQDADRLDALGAVGIARLFATGAKLGRVIHDPSFKLKQYKSLEDRYKNLGNDTSVNHFYEKILLLKDLMNTRTGRQMAQHRHEFIEKYLDEFYSEWEGKI